MSSNSARFSVHFDTLCQLIEAREATVGIIGLGYVGLPLAMASCVAGFPTVGFDVDAERVASLNAGRSPIARIPDATLDQMRQEGRFRATPDYAELSKCDIVVICVPTPLNKYREPDLSYIVDTTQGIAKHLRPGQLVSLESTTYPGTTREVMRPILEAAGLKSGSDFFLSFSPEREDPGNPDFHTATIPKVVGGDGEAATSVAEIFYGAVVNRVVTVSSCEAAEAVKLTENIFRSVNIALVNELKLIYASMGVNIWEVIEAAKSKPFGYMAFYPGPGLGGHCIPIDPFYLTWKAREYDVATRFIELAGEINTMAPYKVVEALIDTMSRRHQTALSGAHILLLGVAYKKNIEDTRESPAFTLIRLIEERGGKIDFYDPFVPEIPRLREHMELTGRRSVDFDPDAFAAYDAVLVCTDHDGVDYEKIAASAKLVVDTRNAMKSVKKRDNIVLA
jgi:UDP-N-acetyl-D-glucosamine dehydrogenase